MFCSNTKMNSRINGHTLLCLEELLGENSFLEMSMRLSSQGIIQHIKIIFP